MAGAENEGRGVLACTTEPLDKIANKKIRKKGLTVKRALLGEPNIELTPVIDVLKTGLRGSLSYGLATENECTFKREAAVNEGMKAIRTS